MKFFLSVLLFTIIQFPVLATEHEEAKSWLMRLSNALHQLNFSTSFVVVKNNQAEPYHWFHGVNDDGSELEILSLLNGPRRDILRKANVVSYIEPELSPYSVNSAQISGPIPAIFSGDFQALTHSYDFVSVGRSRVLGRPAQLIRMVSKDQHRFGYWLWLDQETGLLLKLAILTRKGQMLEQIQFTHLDITKTLSDSLKQLDKAELPPVIEQVENVQDDKFSWKVSWLPTGFTKVKANRHLIASTKQPVEFMQFNDGLVDVSVYIGKSNVEQRAVEYVMNGATVILNQVINGFEISVVGKIPSITAKTIADSVALNKN